MPDFIMGKKPICEILKYKPEIILEIYTSKKENDSFIIDLKKNKFVKFVSKQKLSLMTNSESHQNLVAKIKSRKYWNLKDFLKNQTTQKKSLVLMLDSIFDPQNLGSILRSAECFSINGVIFSKNRGSDITPTAAKASCGATELINLIKVSNLANALDAFIDEGYYILATDLDKSSKSLYSFKFPQKTLLIMGSEGEGIQQLLLKKSDYKIHIPITGRLQSLNVSQATAIILSYFRSEAN